jgi:hypothetical protein
MTIPKNRLISVMAELAEYWNSILGSLVSDFKLERDRVYVDCIIPNYGRASGMRPLKLMLAVPECKDSLSKQIGYVRYALDSIFEFQPSPVTGQRLRLDYLNGHAILSWRISFASPPDNMRLATQHQLTFRTSRVVRSVMEFGHVAAIVTCQYSGHLAQLCVKGGDE